MSVVKHAHDISIGRGLDMNIIIVGIGGHAGSWKKYIEINENWKLVGVVDTDTEKLQHSNLWGVPEENAYPSITAAVKFSDDKIDAVLLTTPIPTHHVLVTEALELGLNVICEKNMAGSIEQAQAMVKLARARPELCTVMGTQYRFRPIWWTLHELFTTGESPVGNLAEIRVDSVAKQGTMRTGWRAWLQHIYAEDMMAHHVDVLRYCTGFEVVKVQAQVFRPWWSQWLGTSSVFCNMVLAPKGRERVKEEWVYCQYHGDWQGRGIRSNWKDLFEFYGPSGCIRVESPDDPQLPSWEPTPVMPLAGQPSGSHIVAYMDDANLNTQVEEVPLREDVEHNPQNHIDQMYILDELADCIRSGGEKQPMVNFEEGYKTFIVTHAAIESSKTGRTVWLPRYWLDNRIPEP
ncbi:MAG TPA: Gfo/Idh/MocA family oxidoreductase [Candidatus Lokiarchaeia archaeon]|nr:Gfo/Idh/MocA family oxidoreductase [Candidatus Lokiarchaeia archaeon]